MLDCGQRQRYRDLRAVLQQGVEGAWDREKFQANEEKAQAAA